LAFNFLFCLFLLQQEIDILLVINLHKFN